MCLGKVNGAYNDLFLTGNVFLHWSLVGKITPTPNRDRVTTQSKRAVYCIQNITDYREGVKKTLLLGDKSPIRGWGNLLFELNV